MVCTVSDQTPTVWVVPAHSGCCVSPLPQVCAPVACASGGSVCRVVQGPHWMCPAAAAGAWYGCIVVRPEPSPVLSVGLPPFHPFCGHWNLFGCPHCGGCIYYAKKNARVKRKRFFCEQLLGTGYSSELSEQHRPNPKWLAEKQGTHFIFFCAAMMGCLPDEIWLPSA